MTWLEECRAENLEKWKKSLDYYVSKEIARTINKPEKKEATTMQVEYNGFTGELVKLEKKETGKYTLSPFDTEKHPVWGYDLAIYDSEKKATVSFNGVKLEDVKFLSVEVSFKC